MAKKLQKGKVAKKVAKPAKKSAVKKQSKPAKKVMPSKKAKPAPAKKTAKPAKKASSAKKPVKVVKKAVSKPAKKVVAKKAGKKIAPKKVNKVASKKTVKAVKKAPAKKQVAKKVIAKKTVKKPVAKAPVKKGKAMKIIKNVAKALAGTATLAAGAAAASKTVKNAIKEAVMPKAAPKQMTFSRPAGRRKAPKREMETIRPRQEVKIDMTKPVIQRMEKPKPKPQINKDTRTRYTDTELQEFKKLIIKKLEEAQKDYELLKSTLSHKDDHGTDDTSPTFKLLEDGSDVLSKEETAHLAARQEKFIQNLQNALIRIENKTYGVCRITGKLISKERLRSVPHATLSIDAKLDQNV
jgi:RNA polymerase-binding transcription factor DksA